MLAVFLAVWKLASQPSDVIIEAVAAWHGSEQLQQLQNGAYTLVLDDYVVDMHTKRGRALGKDRNTFSQEGALVTNRAPQFEQPWFLLLEQIYKAS